MRHRNCQLSIVNYPLSNAILNFTMNKHIKLILPDLLAVVAFVLLSLAYFFPAALEGRVLAQHDAVAGIGSGVEMQEYQQRTGERTRWTNALFGGMPTYQMAPSYDSTDLLKTIGDIYHLYLPGSVWLVFIMLLGFYILLRAFDFRVWMAALGAVLWAFSSYYFIIIAAGHIWKFVTLAYIPPTIAGIVLAYRGKYLWGGIVTALFLALQIQSNHIQMSYYFCFVMLFMAIAFGVDAWKKKEMPRFVKATCTLVVAAAIGACVNLSNLYHTWQYSKESMRGKSELVKADDGNQTDSGLERDYITAWSYGIGETWSLLVPNVKGGASNRGDKPMLMSDNATAMEKADPQFAPLYSQLTQYWGEQPGTSGPVYVGAFVLMLFVLGCFIVKGPMKWALLAATVLSILLSWGKNFMGFTDFFIDYVPMYSKFRTVASILVIAEFTIPLLAMMALREIFLRPQLIREQFKPFVASFLLTGGVAFLFAIMPTVFFSSFISSAEMGALQSSLPSEYVAPIISNLTDMRVAMFTADAWRSFFVVLIGTLLLLFFAMGRLKAKATLGLVAVLCLIDLWSVDKRYLCDEMYVEKQNVAREKLFQPSPADKVILEDKALDYRVLNLATNTFNENETSYFHKSIGGYNAAKLRRYQEMIEEHIAPEMQALYKEVATAGGDMTQVNDSVFPVINMLNTRWFILPGADGQTFPLQNPYAFGNAWFVSDIQEAANANEEIDALHHIDPRQTAVVDSRFTAIVGQAQAVDSTCTAVMKTYDANRLTYEVNSPKGGVVVFSEIYYPGWQAFIDGREVEVGRADYILRALQVPAGKHEVVITFDPVSLHTTETIAYIALALLLVGILAGIVLHIRRPRQPKG